MVVYFSLIMPISMAFWMPLPPLLNLQGLFITAVCVSPVHSGPRPPLAADFFHPVNQSHGPCTLSKPILAIFCLPLQSHAQAPYVEL